MNTVVEPLSLPKTKASKRASRHGAKTKPSRQPYPNFHAVYMLRPQAKALKKMIAVTTRRFGGFYYQTWP